MENIVSCRNVSKIYRQGEVEVRALANVDLDIKRGGFVALCGPSGSGKTTLLNLIGGLDEATSGEISVNNLRIDKMNNAERAELRLKKIGFVFQAYNLIPVLSAKENVEFVMQLQGVSKQERNLRSLAVLKEVGLEGREDRRPSELSGGQQQRVAVARAMVSKPEIILADEPTANLDSKTAETLLELMKELNVKHKITFIFSTHDKLVMSYADRIVNLHDGEINKVSPDQKMKLNEVTVS